MKALPILVVEDDQDLLEAICTTMKLAGYSALPASNGNTAMATLQESQVGMVVSDVQMKPVDGFALLKKIKAFNPELPVLLMTAYGDVEKAVAAMQTGACDYLLKPFDPDNLLAHIKRHALSEPEQDDNVVAKDPRTRALLSLAKRVAQSPATVMLTGESGWARKSLRVLFINIHCARQNPLSRSIARRFRKICWKQLYSVMKKVLLPARHRLSRESLSKRKAAHCCWMKFPKCRWNCKPNCCASCRKEKWNASAGIKQSNWTSVFWRLLIAT